MLKISPDLSDEEIDRVTDVLMSTPLDGIVASNGSHGSRQGLRTSRTGLDKTGSGRLSGAPPTRRAAEIVRRIRTRTGDTYPIHGAGGADAMDGTREALKTIAETVAGEGTTSFLATTMTQSRENILHAMKAVKAYREEAPEDGARILGIHLEGPFIAAAHKGAQPLEYVAKPDVNTFDEYNSASGNAIKIVTLAPEEAGADELVKHLASENIVPSIGHTGAKSADIREAVRFGATNVTHTYKAQSPLHHREIGTVGSALLYDELHCEMIPANLHDSVAAIQLLTKCKH